MVHLNIVKQVNADLRDLADVLTRHKENPHMIRLVNNLVRLTNINDDGDLVHEEPTATEETTTASEPTPIRQGPCEHKSTNLYGKCNNCGECQHTNAPHGVCLTCDKDLSKSS